MSFYTEEDAIKATEKDIAAYEEANAILPAVRKVVREFDGKVFNCRLEKALKELDPRLVVFTHYETTIEIAYRPSCGNNNWVTLFSGSKPSCRYYSEKNSFLTPEKRIDAAKALELMEVKRAERLKEITEYKIFLEHYAETKRQLSMLKKQIDTITSNIPYKMRDYFRMNYRVTT